MNLRILKIEIMSGIICKYMNPEQVVINEKVKNTFARAGGRCLWSQLLRKLIEEDGNRLDEQSCRTQNQYAQISNIFTYK